MPKNVVTSHLPTMKLFVLFSVKASRSFFHFRKKAAKYLLANVFKFYISLSSWKLNA